MFKNVTVLFEDDSTLTKTEAISLPAEEARDYLVRMAKSNQIIRLREVATPDLEKNVGQYVLEVTYASFLMGARIVLIS